MDNRPIKAFLHVMHDDPDLPVRLLLVVNAPPPPRANLVQVTLPHDPIQADVDMHINLTKDLSFPRHSYIGAGAFGQVGFN